MDSKVFEKNVSYLDRFISNQGKKYDFPNFKYEDVRFHPALKDHIIVLSRNHFPKDLKVTTLDYKWKNEPGKKTIFDPEGVGIYPFEYAVNEIVKKYKLKFYTEGVVVEGEEDKLKPIKKSATNSSNESKKASEDKTKEATDAAQKPNDAPLKLNDSSSSSYDYEGGSSDDEKSDKKSIKNEKQDKDKIGENDEDHKTETRPIKSSKSNRSQISKKNQNRPSTAKIMPYDGDENDGKKSEHGSKTERNQKSDEKDKKSVKSKSKSDVDDAISKDHPESRKSMRSKKSNISKKSYISKKSENDEKLSDAESPTKLVNHENEESKNKESNGDESKNKSNSKSDKKYDNNDEKKAEESDSDNSVLALKKKNTNDIKETEPENPLFPTINDDNQDKLKLENEEDKASDKGSDKDERITQTPAEVHNEETKDDADDDKSQEKPEDKDEIKNEEAKLKREELQLSAAEKFKMLTKDQQQEIVNLTCDSYYDTKPLKDMSYQSIDEKFITESLDSQDSLYKLNTENFTYSSEHYFTYYFRKAYLDIEYQPKIMRHTYQLSIWKYDRYGCVKIKDRYFTPKTARASDEDFSGLEILESLDNSKIVVAERSKYGGDSKICIFMDPYSLEIENEFE